MKKNKIIILSLVMSMLCACQNSSNPPEESTTEMTESELKNEKDQMGREYSTVYIKGHEIKYLKLPESFITSAEPLNELCVGVKGIDEENIKVEIENKSECDIDCGKISDFVLSRFSEGQWKKLSCIEDDGTERIVLKEGEKKTVDISVKGEISIFSPGIYRISFDASFTNMYAVNEYKSYKGTVTSFVDVFVDSSFETNSDMNMTEKQVEDYCFSYTAEGEDFFNYSEQKGICSVKICDIKYARLHDAVNNKILLVYRVSIELTNDSDKYLSCWKPAYFSKLQYDGTAWNGNVHSPASFTDDVATVLAPGENITGELTIDAESICDGRYRFITATVMLNEMNEKTTLEKVKARGVYPAYVDLIVTKNEVKESVKNMS